MQRTARFYPQQSFASATFAEWQKSWEKKIREVGFARFEAGVLLARDRSNFFPLPVLIEECIPEAEVVAKNVKDQACVFCAGTGWKDATGLTCEEVVNKGPVRVERCHCVKREFVKVGA